MPSPFRRGCCRTGCHWTSRLRATWLFLWIALIGSLASAQVEPESSDLARRLLREGAPDPQKIVSSESCGECHASAYAVWKKTTHQTGFRTLHRKASAEAIVERMGFRLLKRDSLCLSCHYTATVQRDELRAISGVSCESCHGAARDWLDVHNDYGGKGFDHTSESPEHRRQRIETSIEAGMRRSSDNFYALMSSCFRCHTVPEEELVNVGGHGTGSGDFELVAWTDGEIRHNFLQSFLGGGGGGNVERPMPHKRVVYVLGRALALEHSLRAMAEATEKGVFAKASARRVRKTLRNVRALGQRLDLPELAAMVATVRALDVRPNQRQAMLDAAEAIGASARAFLDNHDGQKLASLDGVILGTEDVLLAEDDDEDGSEEQIVGATTAEGTDANVPLGSPGVPADPSAPGADAATASTAGPRVEVDPGVPATGTFKRAVRPPSSHATIGPESCTSCHRHQSQTAWWFDDAHYRSADPFFEQDPKNVKIATLYGLKRSQISRGDHICMDCHGTVVTTEKRQEVADGVACESCHGPAADYLDSHQEGDASLGDDRPGYRQALGQGMLALRDLSVRATVCTGCHYITEPRLISAGHPSGKDFDYGGGMAEIKHWEQASAPASQITAAFGAARDSRGPVPTVRRARLASRRTVGGTGGGAAVAASAEGLTEPLASTGRIARPQTPRARPRSRRGASGGRSGGGAGAPGGTSYTPAGQGVATVGNLGLPPFPEVDEETSIESILLMLEERLKRLYKAVGEAARTPGDN